MFLKFRKFHRKAPVLESYTEQKQVSKTLRSVIAENVTFNTENSLSKSMAKFLFLKPCFYGLLKFTSIPGLI